MALGQGNQWAQLTWENDIIAGDDAGYTNGIGISWGQNGLDSFDNDGVPSWLYQLIKNTPFAQDIERQRAASYVVAQKMYTPKNIKTRQLVKDDRPYVGLAMWAASLYSFSPRVADQWELVLGVVGPLSGAEFGQKLVHSALASEQPEGWGNQIHNEPVFAVKAQRLWRMREGVVNGLQWDAIAGWDAGVGNLRSQVGGLMMVRFGRGLANTWAAASTIAARHVNSFGDQSLTGWQVYWSFAAGYVANDITIDGNTFRDSHSVELEHWRTASSIGVLQNWGQFGASFSYQLASDEFVGQKVDTRFGTFGITYRY